MIFTLNVSKWRTSKLPQLVKAHCATAELAHTGARHRVEPIIGNRPVPIPTESASEPADLKNRSNPEKHF